MGATNAVGVVRELRSTLTGAGDIDWRTQAKEKLEVNSLSMAGIKLTLRNHIASEVLK